MHRTRTVHDVKPSAASVATLPSAQKVLPSNVRRFEQLMYLSLGLSLVEAPLEWNRFVAHFEGSASGAALAILLSYAIAVGLIWAVARQHQNWARWILLILASVSLPLSIGQFEPGAAPVLAGLLLAGEFLAWGSALYLIFTGNARRWFEISPSTCSKCGAVQYGSCSAFCTRCGTSLKLRYYNAPRARSGWKSIPLIVRLAIYAVSGMILLSVGFWLLMVVVIFGSHPHP